MLAISIYDKFFSSQSEILEKKFKEAFNQNNQWDGPQYFIMKNNFARFWYELDLVQRNKYLELVEIDQSNYSNLNLIIRYVYDLKIGEFDEKFFNSECKKLDFDLKNDNVKQFYRFAHNLSAFWLNLDLDSKIKFLDLVYKHTFKIEEIVCKPIYCANNYESIYKKLDIVQGCLKYKSPDGIPVHEYSQEQIDNLGSETKILYIHNMNSRNIITSINNLPEGIEELYVNCPQILNYDNLPESLRKLSCRINDNIINSVSLNNLPNGLKELEIQSSNSDRFTNNLPPNLKILKITNSNIYEIPLNLPNSIIYLDLSSNLIYKVKNLPSELEYFKCDNNQISTIEYLPNKIKYLDLGNNKIDTIENIPASTEYLDLQYNNIKVVDLLIDKILYLDLSNNKIESIENLPPNLEYLKLHNNARLSEIKKFPNNLKYLNIYKCKFESLDNLPESLIHLDISSNYFSEIKVPNGVEYLNIGDNENIIDIKLPKNIRHLDIEATGISTLDNLSDNIVYLNISNTPIKNIVLPSGLQHLYFVDCNLDSMENYNHEIRVMRWNISNKEIKCFPNNLDYIYEEDNEKKIILPYGVSVRKTQDLYYEFIKPTNFNRI